MAGLDVAGLAFFEIVRIIGLPVLLGLWDSDDADPAVGQDKDVTGADLKVGPGDRSLNEKLVAGDRLDPHHEVLKEPSDLLLILDPPLDIGVDLGEISRQRDAGCYSSTSELIVCHPFSVSRSGCSSGDRILMTTPQII